MDPTPDIMLGITLRDHKRNTWIRHQTSCWASPYTTTTVIPGSYTRHHAWHHPTRPQMLGITLHDHTRNTWILHQTSCWSSPFMTTHMDPTPDIMLGITLHDHTRNTWNVHQTSCLASPYATTNVIHGSYTRHHAGHHPSRPHT